jgi:hypothetical protein
MVLRSRNICPPGVFCLTPGILILFGVIVVAAFMYVYNPLHLTLHSHVPSMQIQQAPPVHVNIVAEGGGDDRYSRPPRPQRRWDNGPEFPPRGMLPPPDGGYILNTPTRGLPESYQSMGLLKTGDGQLLPLFGRRVASRSDRFNYYTRTDTNNPVPLPIHYKRRDCQDDVGCDELMSGEEIKIIPTGQTAQATLYRFDGPTYVPGLI